MPVSEQPGQSSHLMISCSSPPAAAAAAAAAAAQRQVEMEGGERGEEAGDGSVGLKEHNRREDEDREENEQAKPQIMREKMFSM